MKKYIVISNDKINISNNKFYSNFNDTINIISAIQKKFKIYLYSRSSESKNNFYFKIKNKIDRINLFSLFKIKKVKIFMISITVRNFFFLLISCFVLKDINGYVFLRSNGHKEYQAKIGKIGFFVYNVMFSYVVKKLNVISVSKNITKKIKSKYVFPSELDSDWLKNRKKANIKIPLLLYFGRFKKEKGIYSLIEIANSLDSKFKLTMAGDSKKISSNNHSVNFLSEISSKKKIIDLYDRHNIFVLPSYTEGSPKVILESLARFRPVIVFRDIKHVKSNFYGIYVCDRNVKSFKNIIKYILKNYKKIQSNMKKNDLNTKKVFQNNLIKILNEQHN